MGQAEFTDPKIFHITHAENLRGIIAAGCLWSDTNRVRENLETTNIGHQHIKQRRLKRRVPVAAHGVLGEYVPFNFCPRSVMLYVIHKGQIEGYDGGQDSIIHLVSSINAATAIAETSWAFTDRHADLEYAQYFDSLEYLKKVDWRVMPMKYWSNDNTTKEKRQAEFLVHRSFPWVGIQAIGVINDEVAQRVRACLLGAEHQPRVRIEPSWYY